jgi:hypothetical protein
MEVKADERAAAGWKPDGAATAACGACPLTSALGRKHCSDAAVCAPALCRVLLRSLEEALPRGHS